MTNLRHALFMSVRVVFRVLGKTGEGGEEVRRGSSKGRARDGMGDTGQPSRLTECYLHENERTGTCKNIFISMVEDLF